MFSDDSSFPLYDLLLKRCNNLIEENPANKDITIDEVREMIDGIHRFDREKMEHVFVLIRMHSLKNENAKVFDVPFGGEKINMSQTGEGDIKFDIRNMPPILRRMLLEFVRMNRNLD
uniref:NET domain-containing protein n=1 Tax=viral metagenome TaxID=1070528 RepID=A0A6C0DIZ0_9ZZZZ